MGELFYGHDSYIEPALPLKGGKMKGDLNMSYWKLYGVAAPIDPSGAVSKQYLEYHLERRASLCSPKGLICMWSGVNVPSTWGLCDGSNNTPDLRGRFIMSQGNENIGATGGSSSHTLTVNEMPAHIHDLPGYSNFIGTGVKSVRGQSTEINVGKSEGDERKLQTETSGGDQPFSIIPPYYVLAFIMKL